MTPAGKPKAQVDFLHMDGNAFSIMNVIAKALRKTGHTKEEIRKYRKESMEGDYDNLLVVAFKWAEQYDPED